MAQTQLTAEVIDDMFDYHPLTEEQATQSEAIRKAAKELAWIIVTNSPSSPDQSAALRSLRLAVFQANSAIANSGKY